MELPIIIADVGKSCDNKFCVICSRAIKTRGKAYEDQAIPEVAEHAVQSWVQRTALAARSGCQKVSCWLMCLFSSQLKW